jgi:hypothetical protein
MVMNEQKIATENGHVYSKFYPCIRKRTLIRIVKTSAKLAHYPAKI